ncbi:hypothetical protein JHK82_034228 [Glycine max]|nr:hypothetical protein JHK82_034228 [Glycine max]
MGSARMDDADFGSSPAWKSNNVKVRNYKAESWIWMQQAMHTELNDNSCFRKKWIAYPAIIPIAAITRNLAKQLVRPRSTKRYLKDKINVDQQTQCSEEQIKKERGGDGANKKGRNQYSGYETHEDNTNGSDLNMNETESRVEKESRRRDRDEMSDILENPLSMDINVEFFKFHAPNGRVKSE